MKNLTFALILGFIWTALPARADLNYSPKFVLKETNGLLLNEGTDPTLGGMQITYGGITLGYEHFLTPSVSAGAAYHVDFDYFGATLPLSGFDVNVKYFFLGDGTFVKQQSPDLISTRRKALSFYGGLQYSMRGYYIGSNPELSPGVPLTGSISTLNGTVGAVYALSRHVDLTAEFEASILTFAASDDRYRIRGFLLNVGISYVW